MRRHEIGDRKCAVCNVAFLGTYKTKYCSAECAKVPVRRRSNTPEAKAARDKWRKDNIEKVIAYRRASTYKKYGMTFSDFEVLVSKHEGKCAICETTEPRGTWNSWNIDHDHKTSVVRGILCHDCNTALGHFKDDVKLLSKAIDYLETHAGDYQ